MAATRFSDRTVRALTGPGRYGDGNNLWFQVRDAHHRSWLLRYTSPTRFTAAGKGLPREMGLGVYPDVSLARAREKAAEARALLADGIDPLDRRQADKAARIEAAKAQGRTFAAAVDAYLKDKGAEHGRNEKHQYQWRQTLKLAVDTFGTKHVAEIAKEDVIGVLSPIWATKTETAKRLRGRIEAVLSYATFHGWRAGDNPARWADNLKHALARPSKVAIVEHHAALPVPEIPAFLVALAKETGVAARALEFTVLTAARTGEAIGATWAEIDLDDAVWTIPAGRMKAGREHRVALSLAAVAVLRGLLPLRAPDADGTDYVFPGQRGGKPLSNMAMMMLLRRMRRDDLTVHGFRSTFRIWAGETTTHPADVVEQALAHKIGDKVAQAYDRGDRFTKRRVLMADWANFCAKPAAEVVTLAERRA